MTDLIEALMILGKYLEPEDDYPTHCEHEEFYVKGPPPDQMSNQEFERLCELGFDYVEGVEMWCSIRFGSC